MAPTFLRPGCQRACLQANPTLSAPRRRRCGAPSTPLPPVSTTRTPTGCTCTRGIRPLPWSALLLPRLHHFHTSSSSSAGAAGPSAPPPPPPPPGFGFFRHGAPRSRARPEQGGGQYHQRGSSGDAGRAWWAAGPSFPPYALPRTALGSGAALSVTERLRLLQDATPELLRSFSAASAGAVREEEEDEERVAHTLEEHRPGTAHLGSLLHCILLELLYLFHLTTRFVVVAVLFGPVLLTFPLWYAAHFWEVYEGQRPSSMWWIHYLIWAFETSGPTFTKLGQWASSRSDLFPPYVCELLAKLQANVRPHSMAATRRTIRRQYGREVEELFAAFDPEPIGVGAIAQVYRATLRPNKSRVRTRTRDGLTTRPSATAGANDSATTSSNDPIPCAVKILHPGTESKIYSDITIMKLVAHLIHTIVPGAKWLSLPDEVEVFGAMMKEQLDLRLEAAHLRQFHTNFAGQGRILFPEPLTDHLPPCREILVETYVDSLPVMQFLTWPSVFDTDLADHSIDAFLRMLLLDNFVHADLHPGNIHVTFVRKRPAPSIFSSTFMHSLIEGEEERIGTVDLEGLRGIQTREAWSQAMLDLQARGYKPALVFLDAGLVSELSDQNMTNFLDLFSAIVNFDGAQVAQLMIDRSKLRHTVQKPEEFRRAMHAFLRRLQLETLALSRIRAADILGTVLAMVRNHHIKIEGDFVNVAISIMLLEGMARRLNPSMDLLQRAIPVLGVASMRAGTPPATQAVAGSVFWRVWIYSFVAGLITHVPGSEGNTFAPDA